LLQACASVVSTKYWARTKKDLGRDLDAEVVAHLDLATAEFVK